MSESRGRDWGRGVVDLLNTTFDFDIAYVPPMSPPDHNGRFRYRASKTPEKALVLPIDGSRSAMNDQHHTSSQMTPATITNCASTMSTDEEEEGFSHPEKSAIKHSSVYGVYRYRNHDTSSYRLPDFFKRVFAPPNCCTPLLSPERTSFRSSDNSTLRLTSEQRDVLHQAVFGNPEQESRLNSGLTTTAMPNPHRHKSRPRLPWMSINDDGSADSLPQVESKPGSGLQEWQRTEPVIEDEDDVQTASIVALSKNYESSRSALTMSLTDSDPDLSKSTYSAFHETARPNHEKFKDMTRSVLSQQATSKAEERQAEIDRDIEAFLKSTPQPRPLNAPQILALCEGVVKADGTDFRASHSHDSSKAAVQESKLAFNVSQEKGAASFLPRRTIGKLRRSRDRRMLSIDSIHENF